MAPRLTIQPTHGRGLADKRRGESSMFSPSLRFLFAFGFLGALLIVRVPLHGQDKPDQAAIQKRKTLELLEKPRRNTVSSSRSRKRQLRSGRRSSSRWTLASLTCRACISACFARNHHTTWT